MLKMLGLSLLVGGLLFPIEEDREDGEFVVASIPVSAFLTAGMG
jgi:hypothetical protein